MRKRVLVRDNQRMSMRIDLERVFLRERYKTTEREVVATVEVFSCIQHLN